MLTQKLTNKIKIVFRGTVFNNYDLNFDNFVGDVLASVLGKSSQPTVFVNVGSSAVTLEQFLSDLNLNQNV